MRYKSGELSGSTAQSIVNWISCGQLDRKCQHDGYSTIFGPAGADQLAYPSSFILTLSLSCVSEGRTTVLARSISNPTIVVDSVNVSKLGNGCNTARTSGIPRSARILKVVTLLITLTIGWKVVSRAVTVPQ